MDYEKIAVDAARTAAAITHTALALNPMRLRFAVCDVESAVADFAILTSEARSVDECLVLAEQANRLALLLSTQVSAAIAKANTL